MLQEITKLKNKIKGIGMERVTSGRQSIKIIGKRKQGREEEERR